MTQYTRRERTPSAPIRSRTYDLPISASDARPYTGTWETGDGLSRLTRSMVANFLYNARIGIQNACFCAVMM